MNAIEATIAGLQGEKICGTDWGDEQYLYFHDNEWRYVAGNSDIPDVEPYNGSNKITVEWKIYTRKRKINPGSWYRLKEHQYPDSEARGYVVGMAGGRMQGEWVVHVVNDGGYRHDLMFCNADGLGEECEAPR
jgi:hypothetical protein